MSQNNTNPMMMMDPMMAMGIDPSGNTSRKGGSTIPHFSKNGTALSQAERQKIADRRGVCLTCEAKTHNVGVFGKKPLTNDDVYQGTCIRCNGNGVPPNILSEWQSRNQQAPTAAVTAAPLSGISRFRAAGRAVGIAATAGGTHHHHHHQRESQLNASVSSSISSSREHVNRSSGLQRPSGGSNSTFPASAGSGRSVPRQLDSFGTSGSSESSLHASTGGGGRHSNAASTAEVSSSGSNLQRTQMHHTTLLSDRNTSDLSRSHHDEQHRRQSHSPTRNDYRRANSIQPPRSSSEALSVGPSGPSSNRNESLQHSQSMSGASGASPGFNNAQSDDASRCSQQSAVSSPAAVHSAPVSSPQNCTTSLPPTSNSEIYSQSTKSSQHNVQRTASSSSVVKTSLISPESYQTPIVDADKDFEALLHEIQNNRSNADVLIPKLNAYRNAIPPDETDQVNNDGGGLLDGNDHIIHIMSEIRDILDSSISTEVSIDGSSANRKEELFVTAISVLWGLCAADEGRIHQAVEIGCLDPIVDIFINQPQEPYHPEMFIWSLGALCSLAESYDVRLLLSHKGGIRGIISTLSMYESDPAIFEWACRTLYALVSCPEKESNMSQITSDHLATAEHNISLMLESNGVVSVASAMKHHTAHPLAEWHAFRLLASLLDQSMDDSVDVVVNQLLEPQMIQTCLNVLKARPTTTELMIGTCQFLRILVESNVQNQPPLTEIVSPVLRTLGEKAASLDLKASGCHLLATIARGDNAVKRAISENSTFRGIVNGLSSKLDHLYFVRSAMFLLCVLSCDESSFDYSLLQPIKNATESIFRKYPDNVELHGLICTFVANNATISQGQPDCVAMNVIFEICKLPGASSVPQLDRAFSVLISQSPDAVERFVDENICKQLVKSLHSANVDDQVSVCSTLSRIAVHSESARDLVYAASGLPTATSVLTTAESEALAACLLEFISALVSNTSKKAVQLPNDIYGSIVQATVRFPNLTQVAYIATRNAMLKTVPGFNVSTDGLARFLSSILDKVDNSETAVIEALGAVWAYCAKQPVKDDELSTLFSSCLGICTRHRGEGEAAPFNSAVLTEAAGAMASVMHCVKENPIQIPDEDIDLIISILDLGIECDIDNVALMTRMLDVVMTLCFIVKEILIQYGVIVVVIDCMVEHEQNEDIQQKGCAILALLASTENLQVNLSIAETDGIDMLVSALAGFPENVRIQTDACRALSHLSIDHESRMLISSQGGLILLVNAITKFPESTDLLEAACGALLNLSSDAEEEVLASSNVVVTVIETIKSNVLSTKLQEKSLGVLQNISMRSKSCKKSIADVGGIGAVKFVIKEFMGTPAVIERALTTLWSLAVLEENQLRIPEEQGIGLIVNAMMANIQFDKVQKQACGCLCTLSSNSQNKTMIREQGGVDAIVFAMWAHYDSDAVLAEACRALSSLAVNVQTNEVMIASEGEINAILSSMRRFPSAERLQEHACVALRNFLLSTDNISLVQNQRKEVEGLVQAAANRFPDKCSARSKQIIDSLLP